MKNKNIDIPDEAIKTLARRLLPEIVKYFESEEGKREYEEWKTNKKPSGSLANHEVA